MNKKKPHILDGFEERYILNRKKDTGAYYLGEEKLTPEQLQNLKQEAEVISTLELWKIFQNTITDMARKAMFDKAENFDDMRNGKAMLYNLSYLKSMVDVFRKYEKK